MQEYHRHAVGIAGLFPVNPVPGDIGCFLAITGGFGIEITANIKEPGFIGFNRRKQIGFYPVAGHGCGCTLEFCK